MMARRQAGGTARDRAAAAHAARLCDGLLGQPTPERRAKGDLVAVEDADPEVAGGRVRRARSQTTLRRMRARGKIDSRQLADGERVAVLYRMARLDRLRAFDPAGTGGSRRGADEVAVEAEAARRVLHELRRVLGGERSVGARLVMDVLGAETSLSAWCRAVGMSESDAAGRLVQVLDVVAVVLGRVAAQEGSLPVQGRAQRRACARGCNGV